MLSRSFKPSSFPDLSVYIFEKLHLSVRVIIFHLFFVQIFCFFIIFGKLCIIPPGILFLFLKINFLKGIPHIDPVIFTVILQHPVCSLPCLFYVALFLILDRQSIKGIKGSPSLVRYLRQYFYGLVPVFLFPGCIRQLYVRRGKPLKDLKLVFHRKFLSGF